MGELTLGVMGGESWPPHPRAASSQGSPREGRAGWEQVSLSITVSELHRGQEGGASTLQLGSQEDRAAGPGENVEDVRRWRERSCVSFSSIVFITVMTVITIITITILLLLPLRVTLVY